MSDMATNEQTLEAYNKDVATYAASIRPQVDRDLADWITQSVLGLPPSAAILEIGSGTGKDAEYIESLGYRVRRTDGSRGFVDYLQSQDKPAELLNILSDPIEGAYDMIFADAVFLHFTEQEFMVASKKVFESTKNDGRFALSLKRGTGEQAETKKFDMPRYFKFWEPEAATTALQQAGFTDVTITVSDDWRPGKPQWLMIIAKKDVHQ